MHKTNFDLLPFNDNKDLSPNIAIKGSITLVQNSIAIHYQLTGEYEKVAISPVSPAPERTDQLWEQTCFELFISSADNTSYWEYNLSPSHHWAVFRFSDYRQDKTDELSIKNITINTRMNYGESFELDALLPLPKPLIDKKLRIAVSTIIQDNNDVIYYYALTHCNQQADFHNKRSFTISLEPEV